MSLSVCLLENPTVAVEDVYYLIAGFENEYSIHQKSYLLRVSLELKTSTFLEYSLHALISVVKPWTESRIYTAPHLLLPAAILQWVLQIHLQVSEWLSCFSVEIGLFHAWNCSSAHQHFGMRYPNHFPYHLLHTYTKPCNSSLPSCILMIFITSKSLFFLRAASLPLIHLLNCEIEVDADNHSAWNMTSPTVIRTSWSCEQSHVSLSACPASRDHIRMTRSCAVVSSNHLFRRQSCTHMFLSCWCMAIHTVSVHFANESLGLSPTLSRIIFPCTMILKRSRWCFTLFGRKKCEKYFWTTQSTNHFFTVFSNEMLEKVTNEDE